MTLRQSDIQMRGAAIECRINAEDPDNEFAPCPGTIEELNLPGGPGVRIDTHIYPGYTIGPYYDSMVAKLITYGPTRLEAIQTMRRALEEFYVSPLKTTIGLHGRICQHPLFVEGKVSTHFLEKAFQEEGDKRETGR